MMNATSTIQTYTVEALPTYDTRQFNLQILSPRSHLYHLDPIGLGTPYGECLTSYVSRLAEAHAVSVKTLVLDEILSKFSNIYTARPSLIKSFWLWSSVLNGTSQSTYDWTQALAALTLRTDIHTLTMLTWQHVLTSRMLLRRTQAWCPDCYAEWVRSRSEIYTPLLWVLQSVTLCIRHQRRLQSQCPNPKCSSQLPYLFTFERPGYCSKCQAWLGSNTADAVESVSAIPRAELDWQQWVEQAIGDLLIAAVEVSVPPRMERVSSIISKYVEQVTDGNVRALARQLGLSNRGLRDVQLGQRILQLDTLLQICYRLGITPRQFLMDEGGAEQVQIPSSVLPEFRRISRRTYKPFHIEEVHGQLEEIAASHEAPPPSMAEVARRVGHDQSNLTERFPALTRAISVRYHTFRRTHREAWLQQVCNEIRNVMLDLYQEEIYPTYKQIRSRLSDPNALRIPEVRAARRAVLLELGLA